MLVCNPSRRYCIEGLRAPIAQRGASLSRQLMGIFPAWLVHMFHRTNEHTTCQFCTNEQRTCQFCGVRVYCVWKSVLLFQLRAHSNLAKLKCCVFVVQRHCSVKNLRCGRGCIGCSNCRQII